MTIRDTLTRRTPPKPKGSDPAEIAAQLIERSFARHRTLERFERLSPEAQNRVSWRALDAAGAGDAAAAAFLSDLRGEARVPGEAGGLDEKMVARIDAVLMKSANADLFREYEQLAGRLQVDGQHDQITSITRCGEETLRVFMEYLDESIGVTPEAREIAIALDKADTGDAVTLTPEQAHDHRLYVAASDRAAAKGVELKIVGPEGESVVPSAALANGSGTADGGRGSE
jgi:hypothetical protein